MTPDPMQRHITELETILRFIFHGDPRRAVSGTGELLENTGFGWSTWEPEPTVGRGQIEETNAMWAQMMGVPENLQDAMYPRVWEWQQEATP